MWKLLTVLLLLALTLNGSVTILQGRGELRGKFNKNRDPKLGDCIDCRRCIAVCPTGIDIRQGLQMECIGCAACIDACDTVMDKLKRLAVLSLQTVRC